MRTNRDESGSALMMALVMITVIAVMLAAALSFAETSLVATPELVDHRDRYNSVDGAVEGAINSIRGSATLGAENGPVACGPFTPPAGDDGVVVTVQCLPQPGSGSAADDQPAFAITTLGSGPGNGFFQTGNAQLTVDGGLYSNGQFDLGASAQSALLSYGDVFVEGSCNPAPGNLFDSVGGLIRCGYDPTVGNDTRGNDPGYPAGKTSIAGMSVDPVATCVGANTIVAFSPGLYSEIPAAPSGCNGSVWWFQPGVYYFNFPDVAARATWSPNSLSGKTVVAGTLRSGLAASSNASSVSVPGACDAASPNGAQFIFGGPSLLSIESLAKLEICGSVNATNVGTTNHKIAFYGLQGGTRSSVGPTTLAATDTPESPGPGNEVAFAPVSEAKAIDLVPSVATLNSSPNTQDSADIVLPAFAKVPEGATVTSVKLNVRHYESSNRISPAVSIQPLNGAAASKNLTNFDVVSNPLNPGCVTTSLSSCVETWDITSHFTDAYGYKALNGLKVTYSAKVNGTVLGGVASLDGVSLTVTYTAPGFEAHRCPTGSSACSLLSSTVTQNLFFHGTVYTPSAALDLRVHNKDTTIFDRGVIARTLTVNVSSSSKQEDSPFQIPRASTGREVLFVAKTADGVERLRALVEYQDYVTGTNVAYPGYEVTVKKWSVIR